MEGVNLERKLVFCFDIDGVLCYTEGVDYEHSIPNLEIIKKVNDLYDKGYTIKIFTGRGSQSGINWRELTEDQLCEWGVKYHTLIFGKPVYDVFVDDLAWNIKDFIDDNIKR